LVPNHPLTNLLSKLAILGSPGKGRDIHQGGPESPYSLHIFSGPSLLRPEARGCPFSERANLTSNSSSRLFPYDAYANGEELSFLPISYLSWLS
jgi:hypothetical protein